MTIQESMGLRIKQLREQNEMSQTTLAEKVGYKDKTAIAKIEAGKVDLPQSKILSLSKVLNTSTSYLFGDGIELEIIEDVKRTERLQAYAECLKKTFSGTQEKTILSYFSKLNEAGRTEAIKRIEELSYIPKYTFNSTNEVAPVQLNAAHERTDVDVTEDMKKHDDDIMDDDNF